MDTPNAYKNWLTLRNMVPRWGIWTSGLVNLLVLAISAIALWWVFFSNSGIFKLYTPLLGFSLVIWMLLIIMWQTEFFDYWPFSNQFLASSHPLKKGGIHGTFAVLVLISVSFFIIGQYGYFLTGTALQNTASWARMSCRLVRQHHGPLSVFRFLFVEPRL